MERFTRQLEKLDACLAQLPAAEVRQLELRFQELPPEQASFMRCTVRLARNTPDQSPALVRMLDHLLDKWHGHNLATRILILNTIRTMSVSKEAPDPVGSFAAAQTIVERCCGTPATTQR